MRVYLRSCAVSRELLGVLEDGARVCQAVVEPEAVEGVAEVVVVGDVAFRAIAGVGPRTVIVAIHRGATEATAVPGLEGPLIGEKVAEHVAEICALPLALDVALGKAQRAAPERAAQNIVALERDVGGRPRAGAAEGPAGAARQRHAHGAIRYSGQPNRQQSKQMALVPRVARARGAALVKGRAGIRDLTHAEPSAARSRRSGAPRVGVGGERASARAGALRGECQG